MPYRKYFSVFFFGFFCIFFCRHALAASSLYINAKSAMLMNMTSGEVLFSQNPDEPIPPASITKILSLYLVFEAMKEGSVRPSDVVKISRKAGRTGGSRMFIQAGKEVTLGELVKGMAIVSANDASVAVAEYVGGNMDEFVHRMNLKAQELGMTQSHFKNPNGLPIKGQYTTARDILKLSRQYIAHFPQSLNIHSMTSFTYNNITQPNRNRLLGKYPGVDGLKTGHIYQSGYHIVATAQKGDARLIAVVMGSRTPKVRTNEARRLLDEGFRMVASGSKGNIAAHLSAVEYDSKMFR